jgi:hypothetical protein
MLWSATPAPDPGHRVTGFQEGQDLQEAFAPPPYPGHTPLGESQGGVARHVDYVDAPIGVLPFPLP